MELESAIQELISRLEFVSLPGLGSFVKKYEPATPTADGFNPPREYFVFDTLRTFNDEALVNFICNANSMEHKKASEVVSEFVDSIKVKLGNGENVSFHGVGVLKQNAEGVIQLIPFEDSFSTTFGLGKVEATKKGSKISNVEPVLTKTNIVETVKAVEPEKAEPKKSRLSILLPISLIFLVIALVATVIFVPALRFWEENTVTESIEIATNQDTLGEDNLTHDSGLVQESQHSIGTEGINTPTFDEETNKTVTDKKVALYYQETKQEIKSYYIIVGSFTQESNAQKLIQDLSVKGYKPILLQSDNMFRVAVYKFTNRDRALRELERLKEQKLSDKVWLLSL